MLKRFLIPLLSLQLLLAPACMAALACAQDMTPAAQSRSASHADGAGHDGHASMGAASLDEEPDTACDHCDEANTSPIMAPKISKCADEAVSASWPGTLHGLEATGPVISGSMNLAHTATAPPRADEPVTLGLWQRTGRVRL